jgi:hypothetical protein
MAFEDWFIARARVSGKPHTKITLDDKIVFFQQLAALVASGTPLLQVVEIGAEQNQSLKLRHVLGQIASHVASGSSVYGAMAGHGDVFEHYWIEVIRVGETSGQMSLVLGELNKQICAARQTRRKLMGALVELWVWNRTHAQLCNRRDSPWDNPERRPSHADRRKALRRHIMQTELSTITATWSLPRKTISLARRLRASAA